MEFESFNILQFALTLDLLSLFIIIISNLTTGSYVIFIIIFQEDIILILMKFLTHGDCIYAHEVYWKYVLKLRHERGSQRVLQTKLKFLLHSCWIIKKWDILELSSVLCMSIDGSYLVKFKIFVWSIAEIFSCNLNHFSRISELYSHHWNL